MSNVASPFQQHWPMPSRPKPIVLIGAGGIVNDAHLPAYRMAGFTVLGIYDIVADRSRQLADKFGIPRVFDSLAEALRTEGAVIDIAVPPDVTRSVLEQVREGSVVLMQKPMGTDLAEARRIVDVCRARRLVAAVNFQLRFSPMMLAVADLMHRELLGPIVDVDVHLNYREPWEIFPFLKSQRRVEMMIASIHYFDWIRSILGDPAGVYARSIPHPKFPGIEATRTTAILDYGVQTRCCLSLNDTWSFPPKHEICAIRVEGLRGAAIVRLGCLIGYPKGEPDQLEYITEGSPWTAIPLEGSWFPEAFRGTMANLQRFAAGEDEALHTRVDDALRTMALVEALYESNARGATPIPK
jgi:predicted dehydrogenase